MTYNPHVSRENYRVRKLPLSQEGQPDPYLATLSPEERIAMVWELTEQAWTFKEGKWDAPRLRRDVVRVVKTSGPGAG